MGELRIEPSSLVQGFPEILLLCGLCCQIQCPWHLLEAPQEQFIQLLKIKYNFGYYKIYCIHFTLVSIHSELPPFNITVGRRENDVVISVVNITFHRSFTSCVGNFTCLHLTLNSPIPHFLHYGPLLPPRAKIFTAFS